MKRIPRRVLRARPGLSQPWLRSDAPHPTRSVWCVQWLLPSLYLPPTGPCWLLLCVMAGSLVGFGFEPGRGQPWLAKLVGCHAVSLGGVTAAGPPDPMVCSLEASLAESGVILPGQLQ